MEIKDKQNIVLSIIDITLCHNKYFNFISFYFLFIHNRKEKLIRWTINNLNKQFNSNMETVEA